MQQMKWHIAYYAKNVRESFTKIDFAKAFDSINWHFLKEAMRCMKFPEKWIHWMSSFFSTARPSIMINGSPIKEFQMNQGLRQEDPLSPLLFHIVGEMLHLFLEKSSTVGIFEGISVGTNIIVSHFNSLMIRFYLLRMILLQSKSLRWLLSSLS